MNRYQDVLGSTYLRFEERSWLQNVFEKFASRSGWWSESDFTVFLMLSFSGLEKELVRESGSMLYWLMLIVGSYLCRRDPAKAKELTLGTLRTAIILLLRKDEEEFGGSDGDEEERERAARLRSRYPRLIFQSLAHSPGLDMSQTGDTADDDVTEALRIISKHRFLRHPLYPKIGIHSPPLPTPSSLPSSHARIMLGGLVSKADLRNLGRLFRIAC